MKKNNKRNNYKLFIILSVALIYILYVNLLYKVLGETGAIYYIGAYSPIIIFLILFLVGIPNAVSSIISKYDILEYHKTKNRILKILTISGCVISFLLFILIFMFSDTISNMVIKNNDISLEIKLLSVSLIFACVNGVYIGYYNGINHKGYSRITKFIRCLIRIITVIIAFILKQSVKIKVKKIIITLIIGEILSHLLTMIFLVINKKTTKIKSKKEPKIVLNQILKNCVKDIFNCSLVYILMVLYFVFDIVSLNDILVYKINYKITSYESIISSMSFWGVFLIIPFISTILKLLGNIKLKVTKYLKQKDIENMSTYITGIYNKALFLTIPLTILVCFCASSVWEIVYSSSKYGVLAAQYLSILIIGIVLFVIGFELMLSLRKYKMMYIVGVVGVLIKFLFNTALIYGINKLGLPGFYGAITTTFLAFLIPSIITIIYINNKCNIYFETVAKELFNMIIASIMMIVVLILLRNLIPLNQNNIIFSSLVTLIEFIIGISIYIGITYKYKTIKNIFK